MSLSKLIHDARVSKGMTQTELAEQLYTVQQQVCRFESGERVPDFETRISLSKILDIPMVDMFSDVFSALLGFESDNDSCYSVQVEYEQEYYDAVLDEAKLRGDMFLDLIENSCKRHVPTVNMTQAEYAVWQWFKRAFPGMRLHDFVDCVLIPSAHAKLLLTDC